MLDPPGFDLGKDGPHLGAGGHAQRDHIGTAHWQLDRRPAISQRKKRVKRRVLAARTRRSLCARRGRTL